MARLIDLPEDILLCIFDLLFPQHADADEAGEVSTQTAKLGRHLCMVSRRLKAVAEPFLYRSVLFEQFVLLPKDDPARDYKPLSGLDVICKRPELGTYIRHITGHPYSKATDDQQLALYTTRTSRIVRNIYHPAVSKFLESLFDERTANRIFYEDFESQFVNRDLLLVLLLTLAPSVRSITITTGRIPYSPISAYLLFCSKRRNLPSPTKPFLGGPEYMTTPLSKLRTIRQYHFQRKQDGESTVAEMDLLRLESIVPAIQFSGLSCLKLFSLHGNPRYINHDYAHWWNWLGKRTPAWVRGAEDYAYLPKASAPPSTPLRVSSTMKHLELHDMHMLQLDALLPLLQSMAPLETLCLNLHSRKPGSREHVDFGQLRHVIQQQHGSVLRRLEVDVGSRYPRYYYQHGLEQSHVLGRMSNCFPRLQMLKTPVCHLYTALNPSDMDFLPSSIGWFWGVLTDPSAFATDLTFIIAMLQGAGSGCTLPNLEWVMVEVSTNSRALDLQTWHRGLFEKECKGWKRTEMDKARLLYTRSSGTGLQPGEFPPGWKIN